MVNSLVIPQEVKQRVNIWPSNATPIYQKELNIC